MKLPAALALTTSLAAPALPSAAGAAETAWEVDAGHSSAGFKVRHLMVSHVRGVLGPVKGTVVIDDANVTRSRIDVQIDARGLDSKDAKRDEHLRSADFLDVAKHPVLTYRSRAVERGRGGKLTVDGDLTIRGVTRRVPLEVDPLPPAVKDPWGNVKRGATARARLQRKDFGLTWNMALETGGVVVGDQVDVEIEVELVKTP